VVLKKESESESESADEQSVSEETSVSDEEKRSVLKCEARARL